MDEKEILQKLQYFEEKILCKLSELDKLLIGFKDEQHKTSRTSSDEVFYQKLIIPVINICLDSLLYEKLMSDYESFLPRSLVDFRARLLSEKGFIIPPLEINCLDSLGEYCYMIFIRNEIVCRGSTDASIEDPWKELIDELAMIVYTNADKIITREMVWSLLKCLQETDVTIMDELKSRGINIGIIRQVLVNLVKEKISIKDIRLIIQKIMEYDGFKPSPDLLSEMLRKELIYSVLNDYIIENKKLNIILLSEDIEEAIKETFEKHNNIQQTQMLGQMIFESILEFNQIDYILLSGPEVRLNLFRMLEAFDPTITVISSSELYEEVDLNILGTIDLVKCYDLTDFEYCNEDEEDYDLIDDDQYSDKDDEDLY